MPIYYTRAIIGKAVKKHLLVAQSDRARVSEARGHGFNSRQGGFIYGLNMLYFISNLELEDIASGLF